MAGYGSTAIASRWVRSTGVHAALATHGFVAHQDRQGYYPNGFIAAAPGNPTAMQFYRAVAERLRAGKPLSWISLGGEPLTRLLRGGAPFHELPCAAIQPICWSQPERFFRRGGEADLPPADLVLTRDTLVHYDFATALRALANLRRTGASWLLATTFPDRRANRDCALGGWRPLNLTLPPFAFPPPLRLIREECRENGGAYRDKSLDLWRMADLRV